MTDDGDGLTDDGFLGGRLSILQPRHGYRAAMDPVLLAAAAPVLPGESVLDLGCGVGVAGLCAAARVPGIALCGIEIQPEYAALALRNAERNRLSMEVVVGNLAQPAPALRARAFDHVITNPPYYLAGGGTPARDRGRELAMREQTLIADWLAAALRRLRPGGTLTLIQAADRLPAVLSALPSTAGSVVVLPVAPRIGRPASRVLLQARKGGRAAFRLLAPLILHQGQVHESDGDDFTTTARGILRDMHPVAIEFSHRPPTL